MTTPAQRPPALSPTTRALIARLDTVMEEAAKPGCTQSENDLMAQHVRSALNGDDEPMFTEDVLKMCFLDLLRSSDSNKTEEKPTT